MSTATLPATAQDFYPVGPVAEPGGKSLAELFGAVKRGRWAMLLSFAAILAIAVTVALTLPPVYRSTATILIKEQEIPQEFVRSTVTSFADERIQVISQQVMTRATLLAMVDRHGLYGTARQRETSEEILDRMRRDIKLTPISADVTDRRSGSQVKATIAFSLSYESEVPANAQKIANELTTLFLNENVKNRQQKAAETTSFLDEELARVSEHISELEKSLADFKQRNQGRLPEASLSNQAGAERARTEIERLDRDIAFMEERKFALQAQLADTKPTAPLAGGAVLEPPERLVALQAQLSSLVGTYSEEHPDLRRVRREIANLKAETGASDDTTDTPAKLVELDAQLSALRQKVSDDHPDVLRLKRVIAATENTAAEQAQVKAARGVDARARRADNPVYLNLKSQIETATASLQSMRSERKALQQRQQQLDTRLSQAPEVEREYLELVRDFDSSRARFRELRDKQMHAQVAEQLERGRKAERFTLIEPPIFPEKPTRPNRGLILLMGAVLAVLGGVGAVALREALDQTVHSPRAVLRAFQVPVLAVVAVQPSARRLRRRSLRRWLAAGALLGASATAIGALHAYYMPIDVAWYALQRRIAN
jgi:polysaccharide biosynthesis transport protein